jgi:AbrB family looped-hinge helix DNA binding protein
MDVAITKMSSKGQVVIPAEMRKGIKAGEKLLIIENKEQLILKKVKDFDKNLEEDLAFAKRTEEALKKYEAGEFVEMDFDDFLDEVEKW